MNNIQMLINMVKSGGNPQVVLTNMVKEQAKNNPMMDNLLKLMQKNDSGAIEALARNVCKEKGIDIENLIQMIK